jgi:hypothetical protein
MTDSEKEKASNHLDSDNANHIEEWKQARDVLKSYDEHLHDLRKYGFSFLTALLAAGAILTPAITESTDAEIPNFIKFAVFAVTLLLIAALHLLDRNYRVFQDAAVTRALILERKLNIELSEVITTRYRIDRVGFLVFFVYLFFIIGVLLLGGFVLQPDWGYFVGLLIFAAVTAALPYYALRISYANKNLLEDWSISPLESTGDEPLRITLTNMSRDDRSIPFEQGTLIWRINDEDGQEIFRQVAEKNMEITTNYTWIIKPRDFLNGEIKTGVYQLQPRDWPRPLHRRIIVTGDTP